MSDNIVLSVPKAPKRVLLVSHELSRSGAPRALLNVGRVFRQSDAHVRVVSPSDGPYRTLFAEIGAEVLIEPTALDAPCAALAKFAEQSDIAICNTVVTADAVATIAAIIPTYWYIHELSLLAEMIEQRHRLDVSFELASGVWAASEPSAAMIRALRPDVLVLPYGVPLNQYAQSSPPGRTLGPIRISLFGSFEARKGQDLVLGAMQMLPRGILDRLRLDMYGRVLDANYLLRVLNDARDVRGLVWHGELGITECQQATQMCDVVVVPSRDDTLPFVSLDALAAGRVLICTPTVGTATYITHGVNGFVTRAADAPALASTISTVIERRDMLADIGQSAQQLAVTAFSEAAFTTDLLAAVGRSSGGPFG